MQKRENMNKYKNKKVEYKGIVFDSVMERDYFREVIEPLKEGVEVKLQPTYVLIPNFEYKGEKVRGITYRADFEIKYPNGKVDVIDVKGFETADFKIKKKLFKYKYGEFNLKIITKRPKCTGKKWIELEELKKVRKRKKREKVRKRPL